MGTWKDTHDLLKNIHISLAEEAAMGVGSENIMKYRASEWTIASQ
jgi:hypothetical protein